MGRSKLERFRDAHFPAGHDDGARPDEDIDRPIPRPYQGRSGPAPRRSGRGTLGRVYFALKLVLMLAPLTFMLLSVFAECGPRTSSMMPEFVRATACARRDLTRHAFSVETTLKAVSDRLR